MTTMVEKVARAIWEQTPVWHKGNGENAWKLFIDHARAAIEAMEEPTNAMKWAWDDDSDAWISEKIKDPYHPYVVMIKAALKEEGQ
ncbi:hypothetical protein [Ensifer adhaerens]|uniref:hypothetical protein n=1 Tax=Ensifer adhaerens TaxID=106592 RepID=UPI000DC60BD3|nr:hypothetical protein [Ensifer adhaerens]RAS13533.1 hypothetical protein DEU52_106131 [Ensifer adhaerens]